jgi:putative flippase GtrA
MRILFKEALGYAAASGCALLVDMVLLWALVHFGSSGYLPAASTSFLAGSLVAYELSVKIAFKQHRLLDRRAEFAGFVAIGAVGLSVNACVIFVAVNYWALHYMIAKCTAAGFTFTCNFMVRRQLLFVRRSSL